MFPETLLLLLAAASCVHCQIVLTQAEQSVQGTPAGSLKLTCACSGFTLSSYRMHWIRQAPGQGLQWILHYYTSSDNGYAPVLQGRFTASKDSTNIYLHMTQLKPEDSAVYYCARENNGYFDYWGKGTMVTVSTASTPTAPTLFPLVQCGSGTGDMMTLGCIATGFTPASLTFKWNEEGGKSLTDFVQYPAVVQTGGSYMGVSQLRVKRADWDSKTFECAVEHSTGSKEVGLKKQMEYLQHPSLYVMTPSKEEMAENKTASFACFAHDFSPRTHTITWTRTEKGTEREVVSDFKSSCESEKKSEKTLYSSTSYLRVNESEWKSEEVTFTCVFKNNAGNVRRTVGYTSSDAGPLHEHSVVIKITPPSLEDMLMNKKAELVCDVDEVVPGFMSVKWENDNGKTLTSRKGDTDKIAILDITYEDWSNGTVFYCAVDHLENLGSLVKKAYKRETECLVLTDCPCSNTMETDRDSMGKTAFTFIILFLITLLYGVGATAIKVK